MWYIKLTIIIYIVIMIPIMILCIIFCIWEGTNDEDIKGEESRERKIIPRKLEKS